MSVNIWFHTVNGEKICDCSNRYFIAIERRAIEREEKQNDTLKKRQTEKQADEIIKRNRQADRRKKKKKKKTFRWKMIKRLIS